MAKNRDLDKAMNHSGYYQTSNNSGVYSNGKSEYFVDGDYYKKSGGSSWTKHTNGSNIKK